MRLMIAPFLRSFAGRFRRPIGGAVLVVCLATTPNPAAAGTPVDTRCIVASGGAAARCVRRYADALAACRAAADVPCETALRTPGGTLATLLAATEKPVRDGCTAEAADRLTSLLGVDDLVRQTADACRRWGEDFADTAFADALTGAAPATLACQRVVADRLVKVRDTVVRAHGRRCDVAEFAGRHCDRAARDRRIAAARAGAHRQIVGRCGATFDALGLVSPTSGATLADRVDALIETIVVRTRHLALRVYPPLSLGATGLPGAYPVGVRTLMLSDPSRLNPAGTGPRALVTEVYYPSTSAAVAGVPRDVASVLGFPLFPTPTYRDVDRAAGPFPLLMYSPGSGEPRFVHLLLMAHLASHGFVVVGVDHQGNDLIDPTSDLDPSVNRPLDISVLLDQVLAFNATPGDFLEGALDPDRIGAFGHSFGGYTVVALGGGPFDLGTFSDPRIKAIIPLDPGSPFINTSPDAAALFATVHVPTLLFSGPLSPVLYQLVPGWFDAVPAGPLVVAFADLRDAGHRTFTDICEVPDDILTVGGGVPPECQPLVLPWRYARHIVAYLALNFFDATLNGDTDALANLAPARLATIEDLTWHAK